METKETETRLEGQTDHPKKMLVGNENYKSTTTKCIRKRTKSLAQRVQNERIQNVESESPTRKSARVRTLTPKFSGFMKTKAVEALAVPSGSRMKEETHSIENKMAANNLENQNSVKSMRKVQEKTQERKPSTDKPQQDKLQQEQLKSKRHTSKTKPIMRSSKTSIIRQRSGFKPDRKVDVTKDTENTSNKGNKHVKTDLSTGTKRKGIIMKNSDVHVIRRQKMGFHPAEYKEMEHISNVGNKHVISGSKTQGTTMKNSNVYITKRKIPNIQPAEHSSCKMLKQSTDTVIKNISVGDPNKSAIKFNDNFMASHVNDIERKNIIVPRSKKGIMTKKHISILKQNDVNLNKNFANKEVRQSDKTLSAEVDQPMAEENNASKSNRVVETTSNASESNKVVETDSDKQFCDSRSYSKLNEEDNFRNENVEQKKPTGRFLTDLVQRETQTPKSLKYNIDFRKNKTHKAVSLFQKQYNDFVLTTRDTKNDQDVTDNVKKDNNFSDSETKSDLNPSLNVLGEQVFPFSTQVNRSKQNAELVNKGAKMSKETVNQNNITISKTESPYEGIHVLGEEKPNSIIHIKTKHEEISKTEESDLNRQISENTNTDSNETSDGIDIPEKNLDSSHCLAVDRKMLQESVLEEVVGRTLECPLCMKIFEDEKAYILHKGSQCNLNCTYCSLEFKSKNKKQFLKHVSRHETGVNFQCPDCQRLFWNDSLLSVHRRIYAEEGPILCTVCCARFYSQFDLIEHVGAEHMTPLVYSCDVCSARYGSKDFLIEKHFADGILSFYSCALCESTI